MYFKHFEWTIGKLKSIRSQIDPKPQYQRGDAWDDKARSLLIDSILSNFDIPKIYLRHSKNIGSFDYEVADGQQRLKALWKFLDNDLTLAGMSAPNQRFDGKTFDSLTEVEQKQITDYIFITTVVYNATNEETRELFRRLQLGVRLNSAELRNSMASALGDAVRAMALTHPFFVNGPFSLARYKADDLVAHAFAVIIYKRMRDMKAPDLKDMYLDYATTVSPLIAEKVNAILHFMNRMQQLRWKCIITKWGFIDLVGVLATRDLQKLDEGIFADAYISWEAERAKNNTRLPDLAIANIDSRDRNLYDYIVAFQKEGATKRSLTTRFKILNAFLP